MKDPNKDYFSEQFYTFCGEEIKQKFKDKAREKFGNMQEALDEALRDWLAKEGVEVNDKPKKVVIKDE